MEGHLSGPEPKAGDSKACRMVRGSLSPRDGGDSPGAGKPSILEKRKLERPGVVGAESSGSRCSEWGSLLGELCPPCSGTLASKVWAHAVRASWPQRETTLTGTRAEWGGEYGQLVPQARGQSPGQGWEPQDRRGWGGKIGGRRRASQGQRTWGEGGAGGARMPPGVWHWCGRGDHT